MTSTFYSIFLTNFCAQSNRIIFIIFFKFFIGSNACNTISQNIHTNIISHTATSRSIVTIIKSTTMNNFYKKSALLKRFVSSCNTVNCKTLVGLEHVWFIVIYVWNFYEQKLTKQSCVTFNLRATI